METAVKRAHLDNSMLCYWLSTCISMLVKLRKKQDNDYYDSPTLQGNSSSATSPFTRFEYALTALASKVYPTNCSNGNGTLYHYLFLIIQQVQSNGEEYCFTIGVETCGAIAAQPSHASWYAIGHRCWSGAGYHESIARLVVRISCAWCCGCTTFHSNLPVHKCCFI